MQIKTLEIDNKTLLNVFTFLHQQLLGKTIDDAIQYCQQQSYMLIQDVHGNFKFGRLAPDIEQEYYESEVQVAHKIPATHLLKEIKRYLDDKTNDFSISHVSSIINVRPLMIYVVEVYFGSQDDALLRQKVKMFNRAASCRRTR